MGGALCQRCRSSRNCSALTGCCVAAGLPSRGAWNSSCRGCPLWRYQIHVFQQHTEGMHVGCSTLADPVAEQDLICAQPQRHPSRREKAGPGRDRNQTCGASGPAGSNTLENERGFGNLLVWKSSNPGRALRLSCPRAFHFGLFLLRHRRAHAKATLAATAITAASI